LKKTLRYSLYLLVISALLTATGTVINSKLDLEISVSDIVWLTLSFYCITVLSLFIFFKGQMKVSASQPFYTMISEVVKFLMELVLALIWFLIVKKVSTSFIILFFILYLTFTLFSIFVILNTLKNKSLQE
jgi:hypothetical protein